MTVLILDAPRYASIIKQLPLSEDVQQFIAPVGNIGPAARAIYLASLDSGGTKAQMNILRDNPQVEEWFVLSVGTEEDSWMSFRDRLFDVSAPVYTFSRTEDLIQAMKRPEVRKNSCLVLSRQATPDADQLITVLKTWLPDWHFEQSAFSQDPEACFHTGCGKILLLGHEPLDFLGARFPENATPLLVMTRIEDDVLQSLHPQTLIRNIFKSISGLQWSPEMQIHNFYQISTLYEGFRLGTLKDSNLINSLAQDSRFDMWDRYGLPEPRSTYTKERMSEFLNQFDGCERIAARLLNKSSDS